MNDNTKDEAKSGWSITVPLPLYWDCLKLTGAAVPAFS